MDQKVPITWEELKAFEQKNKLFERARQGAVEYLQNWESEEPERYREEMKGYQISELNIRESYVSIRWDVNYTPPMLIIYVVLQIYDLEGSYIASYCLMLDEELEACDDMLSK